MGKRETLGKRRRKWVVVNVEGTEKATERR